MAKIAIVDTTLRDGQQSLWACRMRAAAMLPALEDIDQAGFDAIEFSVPTAQIPRAVRDLEENPWDWLILGTEIASKTSLRMQGSMDSKLASIPLSIQHLFVEKLVGLGIDTTRTSDPWNDFSSLESSVELLRGYGLKTVVNIVYSVSPRHTEEYYARKTREAVALNPYRLCLKDVGGIMTPDAARRLVPIVLRNAGDVPVEFHAHCNSGLAPYVVMVAVELGIRIVHTAIPPLANGTSQPSVFSVVQNLRERGHEVDIDLGRLRRASEHFFDVAEQEGLPTGVPAEYDERLFDHQVAGGMISNMNFQLAQLGYTGKTDSILEEIGRVRAEWGYPIMVTPLAQFLGTQAMMNVVTGKRYGTVTDETIGYAQGNFGVEAVELMDPEVRSLILNRPRALEVAELRAELSDRPQLSVEEVRSQFGGKLSDEELIVSCFLGSSVSRVSVPPAGNPPRTYEEYRAGRTIHTALLSAMRGAPAIRHVQWRSGTHQVTLTN